MEHLEEALPGPEEMLVVMQLGDNVSSAEVAGGERDQARDLEMGYTEAGDSDDDGGQGPLYTGAEELRVLDDEGGHVGAGEAEVREEGEHGVGLGWGFEVGELRGVPECLGSGEAAGVDEVVLDGEFRIRGNGRRAGGEEAVEMGDGRGSG